ncbi:anaphase-promoting complex subunit 4 WD40 domain-containing protein [Ditylenchus destructor]|nr:anaphase-promoting complex subunit 4 WD40 domain-containing protein [Ditylenchus destructor]
MLKKPMLTPSRNANYRKGSVQPGDRYIGVRSEEQLKLAHHLLNSDNASSMLNDSPATRLERESKFKSMRVEASKENAQTNDDRVCAFRKGLAPSASNRVRQPVRVIYSCSDPTAHAKRSRRHICQSPERILDAPGISDNFYASLADWSSASVVAVALGQSIYLWDSHSGNAKLLIEFQDEASPTLVKWSHEGQYLSVGLSNGDLKIFDIRKNKCLRSINVQSHRIACGDWTKAGILSYGTRSGRIYHHDVRIQNSLTSSFDYHSYEVCGLKWSNDEKYLTTGGADAVVNVWEHSQICTSNAQPIWSFNGHSAAVKAIEYVPFLGIAGSNIVATGGGTNDHTVRLWNLTTGTTISTLDTGSQVSAILFSKPYKEMITGHGNPNCGVRVWRYNSSKGFEFIANLKSSDKRILGLCQNPDRSYVMSTSEDETMHLWRCWKSDSSMTSNLSNSRNGSQSSASDISDLMYNIR